MVGLYLLDRTQPGYHVGTVLFQGVRIGFTWFVSSFGSFNLVYGSLGALMAVLIWAYRSCLALPSGLTGVGVQLQSGMVHETTVVRDGKHRLRPEKPSRRLPAESWQPRSRAPLHNFPKRVSPEPRKGYCRRASCLILSRSGQGHVRSAGDEGIVLVDASLDQTPSHSRVHRV